MSRYLSGLTIMVMILIPLLWFIHSFESQKNYLDLSVYSSLMFLVLSVILLFFLSRSLKSTNKQLFISFTMTNMLVKMFCSIVLLLVYKQINHPPDGKFIIPFIFIYALFTIFETWFMIRLAERKP
ncbi:MAG: hypothetical protein WAU01_07270 [Saprospiraceae bacterium]